MGKMETNETADELADILTFDSRVFDKQEVNSCYRDCLPSTVPTRTPPSALLSALEGVLSHSTGEEAIDDWSDRSTHELIDYILRKFHRPLGVHLLNLEILIDMIIETHRKEIGELMGKIRAAFVSLRGAILEHLMKEEDIVFPWIRSGNNRSTVKAIVYDMRQQHRGIAAKMKTVVGKTSRLPGTAGICVGQQALYATLEELEAGLFYHIYMENNVLYPRVLGE